MCNPGSFITYIEYIWMEVGDYHTNDDCHMKIEVGNSLTQKIIFRFLLLEQGGQLHKKIWQLFYIKMRGDFIFQLT